ncbi:hypothetical protein MA16_Dca024721 [Dendrobium catenatum]|uniref:Uncharacterized protein n=1 Tax=Dendrobium catenatum TaxID=906689 RepID=A0A2I0VBH0_9ASPA|nr:hypothetical protein MA16_Dca024721 [Dendrobium catenatum]
MSRSSPAVHLLHFVSGIILQTVRELDDGIMLVVSGTSLLLLFLLTAGCGSAQMRFQPLPGRYLAAVAENIMAILDVAESPSFIADLCRKIFQARKPAFQKHSSLVGATMSAVPSGITERYQAVLSEEVTGCIIVDLRTAFDVYT